MEIKNVTIRLQNGKRCVFPVADSMPEGWKVIEGATAAPNGYKWINNGCSPFSKGYRHAIIKDEDIK